ncbi:hypothetical protein NQ314_000096 [Rhamnusium bicolor]|uniref:Uncharacterized protein n=1 Tax=Rhamnusium bicolor TaxID=1586634 RepID=A0AAV8ZWB2_9CUCU|nr:hypothetical protein NQ314_000096 [Rhamnusium bicolor]
MIEELTIRISVDDDEKFYITTALAEDTEMACGAFDLTKYENLWQWYQRAKTAMSGFGYDEINQSGADAFGGIYKSKLK